MGASSRGRLGRTPRRRIGSNPRIRLVHLLALLPGMLGAHPAAGQSAVFFDGGLHGVNSSYSSIQVIGPGTHLFVLPGASTGDLVAEDTAKITMLDGYAFHVSLRDQSSMEMLDGHVEGDFGVSSGARLTMRGGLTGWTDGVYVDGRFDMHGGQLTNELLLQGNGTATIGGGSVWVASQYDSSRSLVFGDAGIGAWYTFGDSGSIVFEGDISRVWSYQASTIAVYGRAVDELFAYDSSTIDVYGTDFSVDAVPVAYGPLASLQGTLTGTLATGDSFSAVFRQGGGSYSGTITLHHAPEPGRSTLLASGLVMLAVLSRSASGGSRVRAGGPR